MLLCVHVSILRGRPALNTTQSDSILHLFRLQKYPRSAAAAVQHHRTSQRLYIYIEDGLCSPYLICDLPRGLSHSNREGEPYIIS